MRQQIKSNPSDSSALVARVGRRIAARRRELGLSQADLAARTGWSTPVIISRYECGQREMRISTLQSLADALDLPPGELLRVDPEPHDDADVNFHTYRIDDHPTPMFVRESGSAPSAAQSAPARAALAAALDALHAEQPTLYAHLAALILETRAALEELSPSS
jgi:hypothetical protein